MLGRILQPRTTAIIALQNVPPEGTLPRKQNDPELTHLAMQIIAQLPPDPTKARQVLSMANELLDLALDDTEPRPIDNTPDEHKGG